MTTQVSITNNGPKEVKVTSGNDIVVTVAVGHMVTAIASDNKPVTIEEKS